MNWLRTDVVGQMMEQVRVDFLMEHSSFKGNAVQRRAIDVQNQKTWKMVGTHWRS